MVRPAVQRYAAKSGDYLASVRPSPRRDLLQSATSWSQAERGDELASCAWESTAVKEVLGVPA
jgi:hypothetical protein